MWLTYGSRSEQQPAASDPPSVLTKMHLVYLDYAATTPMRSEVREAMDPYLSDTFGNPSSLHQWGRRASAALESARAIAAEALGSQPSEIFFTRGGTESDNLAVLGRCRAESFA
jgi:cysteine desulfurase